MGPSAPVVGRRGVDIKMVKEQPVSLREAEEAGAREQANQAAGPVHC